MLSASLRRYRCNRSLKDLKQRLLYTLAGYISRDRHVLGLLGDLIDLIDIDDTVLCTLNVVICRLNNLQEDILYILTDITCLCQRCGICNRKRHI